MTFHVQNQSQQTKQQIKEEFEKLHQFLRDEEEVRIAAVEEEEKHKSQPIRRKAEEINNEVKSLADRIRILEKEMETCDCHSYKTLSAPENTPVTLDPNTAHSHLHLSEDLTTAEFSVQGSALPDVPERFDVYPCVLGSEGFNSGTHCWDVEVEGSNDWTLGVVIESESRKEDSFWGSLYGLCYNGFGDQYWTCCPGETNCYITPKEKVQRIRVQVDWRRGEVTFTDLLARTHLHTITHKFIPVFFKWSGCFRILIMKTFITTEN